MKGKKREKICFYGAATASKSYISFIHLDWDIAFFISEGSLLLSDHCCQLPFWELCCLWYLWYFPLKKEPTFCSSDDWTEECLWKFASFFFFIHFGGFVTQKPSVEMQQQNKSIQKGVNSFCALYINRLKSTLSSGRTWSIKFLRVVEKQH